MHQILSSQTYNQKLTATHTNMYNITQNSLRMAKWVYLNLGFRSTGAQCDNTSVLKSERYHLTTGACRETRLLIRLTVIEAYRNTLGNKLGKVTAVVRSYLWSDRVHI